MLNLEPAIVEAVLRDWQSAPISRRLRAGIRLLETMTRRPREMTPAFVEELARDGLDTLSIEAAANVGFHFNFINRLADAFDFPLPDEAQKAKLARLLHRVGKLMGGKPPSPSFTRGADGVIRPVEIERGRTRLLSVPGATDPGLRLAVEGYTARIWGADRADCEVPETWRPYLDKLGRHAFKIIDEDVEKLRSAGYEKDAIFELTFTGAFGAAVAGLERVFEALHGSARTSPLSCRSGESKSSLPPSA